MIDEQGADEKPGRRIDVLATRTLLFGDPWYRPSLRSWIASWVIAS